MRLEAVGRAIRYRWPGGEIVLTPGEPVEVEPDRARRILAKLGDRVRAVEKNSRPVYFETMRGEILGPAAVLHLAAAPDGQGHIWGWFCLSFQGCWRWVREDRLRPAPK